LGDLRMGVGAWVTAAVSGPFMGHLSELDGNGAERRDAWMDGPDQ